MSPDPDWTLLRRVSEFFDLGAILSLEHAGGFANQNWFMNTDQGLFLAKILRDKTKAGLTSEAAYLKRVSQADFNVATFQTAPNGDLFFEGDDCLVAIYDRLDGQADESPDNKRLAVIATKLAQLHNLDPLELPARGESWWRPGYLRQLWDWAQKRFGTETFEAMAFRPDELLDLPDHQDLPRTIIHGDPWPGNVLFSKSNEPIFIDWEETTLGPALIDLAYFVLQTCLWGQRFDPARFELLRASYESVRLLNRAERSNFEATLRFAAATTFLWILSMEDKGQENIEEIWATAWYRDLKLDQVRIDI